MPYIIAVIIGIILAATVIHKIRHGGSCCGEHESAAAKIRAADTDISHYPHRYEAVIEGMVCANCVRNVENAFNSADGIYARVDLGRKTAEIYSKRSLERRDAVKMLEGTSYTLMEFREVKE